MIKNREKTIEEYNNLYFRNRNQARNLIKKLDYKNDHHLLQLIAQSYLDDARFTDEGNEKIPYDRRKLRYAERYAVKAFKMCPWCSNVLWTLGQIRKDYQQNDSAIFLFQEIIYLRVARITKHSCKNTLRMAKAQINDSKFELYRLFHKSNPSLSKRYLTLYKKGLKNKCFTLFKPVNKFLLPEVLGR